MAELTSGGRALVTGGSGFIGSHLVRALSAVGVEVLSLDVRPPPWEEPHARHVEIDLLDRDAVIEAVSNFAPDWIFNLAAEADILKSTEAFLVNTRGLGHLIEGGSRLSHRPHLIHASTQLVVGPGPHPTHDRDYRPYTQYGESKAEAEALLWGVSEGPTWTIVRPTTVWGPMHPSFPDSIWKYIARRWYLLARSVDAVRSYGYVGNVVHQLMQIAHGAEGFDKKVFYVGDEPIRSSVWLDAFSVALTGRPVRRIPSPLLSAVAMAGELSGRLGGPSPINQGRLYRMSTDYPVPMAKTFELLGRGPHSLASGVDETVRWLKVRD